MYLVVVILNMIRVKKMIRSYLYKNITKLKNNQDNHFNENKLTNLDRITINRGPCSYNELANKQYVDDSIEDRNVLRFNQSVENNLKISVGNGTYILTKH